MNDDVTLPGKIKIVTPIRLESNISKTAEERHPVPNDHQQEMAYGNLMVT